MLLCILSKLPLVSAGGRSTTTKLYDLVLGSAKLTDHRAVMSQQPSLVNCGDYIELVSQQKDVRYFS